MMVKKKQVMVTGGAGFLGSHLCERLVEYGHDVLCVDNYFTGCKDNIAALLESPKFEAMRHDISFPLSIEVDEIYNLACPASPIHYQFDPVQTAKTSVLGAINMLGLARRVKGKILQASTSEIYGDPIVHPQCEDYRGNVNPIGPRACYDEGKRMAETLFFDYHRQHRLPIRVARIFNTYGPRMHPNDGRVVSNFVVKALKGEPLVVYGDGQQTRAFCYVDDLIEGILRLMAAPDDIVGPINLGNPIEMTVRELAERVIDMTGSRSRIVTGPLPIDDPMQRCPDISRAQSLLDWEPRVPLAVGLEKTIAYFDRALSGGDQATHRSGRMEPPVNRPISVPAKALHDEETLAELPLERPEMQEGDPVSGTGSTPILSGSIHQEEKLALRLEPSTDDECDTSPKPVATVFGIPIHDIDAQHLFRFIDRRIALRRRALILHSNAHLLTLAYSREWLRSLFNRADLVFCDGFGTALAARFLGGATPTRATVADWIHGLIELCGQRNYSIYILGSGPGVAATAAKELGTRYPGAKFVGTQHGFFDKDSKSTENAEIIKAINAARPNVLFVGLGMPLQELWLKENWDKLDVDVALSVGAAFDYVAGVVPRAPSWITNNGFEWLARLCIEPRRLWRRYVIGLPVFLGRVLLAALTKKEFA